MKTLFSAMGGAVQVTEDQGEIKLAIAKSLSAGGGEAQGIVSLEGEAHVVIKAEDALKLGEAILNHKLPASVEPLAEAVEAIANKAIESAE